MKKIVVLIAILAIASVAFGQRTVQDLKLGKHDVLVGTGSQDRAGCQGCHIPHNAAQEEYLWPYALNASQLGNDGTTVIPVDNPNAFHTLACLSCHDGVTAGDVAAANFGGSYSGNAKIAGDAMGLMNDHPVHQTYSQRGATSTTPAKFVSFFTTGVTQGTPGTAGYIFGYVECASCHNPHKGDTTGTGPDGYATLHFLRGPSPTKVADAATYGFQYTTPSQEWGRLGLCRDCHGSR